MAIKGIYTFPELINHGVTLRLRSNVPGLSLQGLWGFQRTYRKNFYLNLEIGFGFSGTLDRPLYPAGGFAIGYTFP